MRSKTSVVGVINIVEMYSLTVAKTVAIVNVWCAQSLCWMQRG